jgi:hypothetical protein
VGARTERTGTQSETEKKEMNDPLADYKWREGQMIGNRVKYWEIIADNLSKAGWSLGWVSAVDSEGRTIWIADAHRDGKRFIVRADEKLTAFLELEAAMRSRK